MTRLLWLIPVGLLVLGVCGAVSVWNECREGNSWLYCVYMMGAR